MPLQLTAYTDFVCYPIIDYGHHYTKLFVSPSGYAVGNSIEVSLDNNAWYPLNLVTELAFTVFHSSCESNACGYTVYGRELNNGNVVSTAVSNAQYTWCNNLQGGSLMGQSPIVLTPQQSIGCGGNGTIQVQVLPAVAGVQVNHYITGNIDPVEVATTNGAGIATFNVTMNNGEEHFFSSIHSGLQESFITNGLSCTRSISNLQITNVVITGNTATFTLSGGSGSYASSLTNTDGDFQNTLTRTLANGSYKLFFQDVNESGRRIAYPLIINGDSNVGGESTTTQTPYNTTTTQSPVGTTAAPTTVYVPPTTAYTTINVDTEDLCAKDDANIVVPPMTPLNESELVDLGYTLSYYPQVDSWISAHNYIPKGVWKHRRSLFSFHNGTIYKHNVDNRGIFYDSVIYRSIITPVFKLGSRSSADGHVYPSWVYNLNWVTSAIQNHKDQRNLTFTAISVHNSYQDTEEIELIPFKKELGLREQFRNHNIRRTKNYWNFNKFRNFIINQNVIGLEEWDKVDSVVFLNINPVNTEIIESAGINESNLLASQNKPFEQGRRFNDDYIVVRLIFDNQEQAEFIIHDIGLERTLSMA